MRELPEIRIYFSFLLYYGESKILAGDNELGTYEGHEKWTKAYRKEWMKYEKRVLSSLTKVLGISFYKPVIDVACAPYFVPKSDPLIMNFRYEPDEFVDVLTHELCHILLTDNNKTSIHDYVNKPKLDLAKEWKKLYSIDDFNALVHVPVHALSKYIYLDVLKQPERLKRDMKTMESYANNEAYVEAWDYVNEHDYKKIIEDLKKMYEKVQA